MIIVMKVAADQALYAGSSTTAVLAVGTYSGYLFPAAGPNYTDVWAGLASVVVGITALTIGLTAAYRTRRTT